MKFRVFQSEFSRALFACDKSLLSRANLPILSNILLTVSKNKLEVLATNLETATKVSIVCKTEKEGKITLPGKVLSEFVSQLPEEELTLELLGEEVLVESRENSARLATIPADEFPAIPKIESGRKLTVNTNELASCARKVEFCAAQDETRPILSGVLIEVDKKKLSMVATDGYRLSYVTTSISEQLGPLKLVIPAKSVAEVAKIIAENLPENDEEPVTIIVADNLNQVNFKIAEIEFTSRLIEGEFPNWQKIIPTSFATRAKISKAALAKQIRIASIFARDSGNIVRLKLEDKTLTVLANTSQVGGSETKTSILEMTGKGGEIAFNFRYLLEALSAIDDEDVYFEMIESLSPGRITGVNHPNDFFHIIMPVRLQA